MKWHLIERVCEGGYLSTAEVFKIWRDKEMIEFYVSRMLLPKTAMAVIGNSTNDAGFCKCVRDAQAVRTLEIMDAAVNRLSLQDRNVWLWHIIGMEVVKGGKIVLEDVAPVYLGQYITSTQDSAKSCNPVALWKKRAYRRLKAIAGELSELMREVVVKGG